MDHVLDRIFLICLVLLTAIAIPIDNAQAYVGPGLGLGTLTVILGLIGSVFLAIFAVVWYPLKRMIRKRKAVSVAKGE